MKKTMKLLAAALAGTLVLGGCAGNKENTAASAESETVKETEAQSTEAESSQAESETEKEETETSDAAGSGTAIRIGSLKGPTSMGLAELMDRAEKGETENDYTFTMAGKADELVGSIASGDLDIVLVPVASDDSISSMEDLKGKTVYMTGKGTTPEYVMNYLLSENGLADGDVTLEFKSEATEVASVLKEDSSAVGVLPQPFATAACIQNEALKPVLDLTEPFK